MPYKYILSLGFLFIISQNIKAQDTIFLKNKTTITCNVYDITENTVFYTPWKQEEPRFEIAKRFVDSVLYNNGDVVVFNINMPQKTLNKNINDSTISTNNQVNNNSLESRSDDYMEAIGVTDANNATLNGVGTASFCSGLGCGILGVIAPATEINNVHTRTDNFVNNTMYDRSKIYKLAYAKEYNKRAVKKIINNYIAGIATQLGIFFGLVLLSS